MTTVYMDYKTVNRKRLVPEHLGSFLRPGCKEVVNPYIHRPQVYLMNGVDIKD